MSERKIDQVIRDLEMHADMLECLAHENDYLFTDRRYSQEAKRAMSISYWPLIDAAHELREAIKRIEEPVT